MVIEDFDYTWARFVAFDIEETVSNDAPALSEIEVVDSRFGDLDIPATMEFADDPFRYVFSKDELGYLFTNAGDYINLGAFVYTNDGESSDLVPVKKFFVNNHYQFILKTGGTNIEDIQIVVRGMGPFVFSSDPMPPVFIKVLNISELKNMNLIKSFSEN